ncbi:TonB family protein [Hymenobacter negativus]|uniref:TonB family protein n=1 Tax=Hymenobacter negativus TaxID=2795026 RepID=A0ABS3QK35_9BACT|nr:TonB family protein [Hymenobacter negativus]MBO2011512.1 TonB family protein [Hymenobacter negativus]
MLFSSTLLLVAHVLAGGPHVVSAPVARPASLAVAPVVAGRVINEQGQPLPGVVVAVQGSAQLTSTNSDGDFLLTLNTPKTVLVFKCQGYREQSLPVSVGNALTVKMYSLKTAAPSTLGANAAEAAAVAEGAASKPQVLNFSEVLPTFPGGDVAYRAYMRQNAHFPEEAQTKRASGTVYVGFVVDEQGRIVDAEVVRGVGFGFDQEALRLIRLMPWWNPGTVGGKPVRVTRTLGVPFVFREKE